MIFDQNEEKEFKIRYSKGLNDEKAVRTVSHKIRSQNLDENWKLVKSCLGKKGYEKLDTHYKVFESLLFRRTDEDSDSWKLCWPESEAGKLIKYTRELLALWHPEVHAEMTRECVLI